MRFTFLCLDWVEELFIKLRQPPHSRERALFILNRGRYTSEPYGRAVYTQIRMNMKKRLRIGLFTVGAIALSGCSSMMSHTGGGEQGYYPGTRNSYKMLADGNTSWGLKPLVALDMPFTVVADTLLVPWDAFRTDKSVKARVEESEKKNYAINAAIPPAI